MFYNISFMFFIIVFIQRNFINFLPLFNIIFYYSLYVSDDY